jgi:GTP-binding protein HflX
MGGAARMEVRPGAVAVSAISGEGLDALRAAIDARIAESMDVADYAIPPEAGGRLAWLYQHGEIVARRDEDTAIHVTVRLLPADRARFERQE